MGIKLGSQRSAEYLTQPSSELVIIITSPCLVAAERHFSAHVSISRKRPWNCCGSSSMFSAWALSRKEDGKMVSSQSKMSIASFFFVGEAMPSIDFRCNDLFYDCSI